MWFEKDLVNVWLYRIDQMDCGKFKDCAVYQSIGK